MNILILSKIDILINLTNKTIDSLKEEESCGTNAAIVYHGRYFAVFDMDEYTYIIAQLKEEARNRLTRWIDKNRQFRSSKGG